ncbi:MAG: universal stress protein, partial [Granulosicoccus sp.]
MQSTLLELPETKKNNNQEECAAGWVFVRIEQEDLLPMIIPHAQAVAFGLARRLRLIEILEPDHTSVRPPDPVEWDLRRREAQLHLEKLATHYADERCSIDTRVLERFVPDEVGSCDSKAMPILGFGRHHNQLPWQLDSANRRFLETHCSSVLMVPDEVVVRTHVSFGKIMVPLDGSSRAELALPLALEMAKRHGAEIFIAHAAPEAILTVSRPLEAEALELMHRVKVRNQRVAAEYLAKIRSRFSSTGVIVNTHIV